MIRRMFYLFLDRLKSRARVVLSISQIGIEILPSDVKVRKSRYSTSANGRGVVCMPFLT